VAQGQFGRRLNIPPQPPDLKNTTTFDYHWTPASKFSAYPLEDWSTETND
jgi:hypothetical protein